MSIFSVIGFNYSQNNRYIITLKHNCKVYQKADFNSQSLKNLPKGAKLYVIGKVADFLKTTDGQYINRNDAEIREDKAYRTNVQIDLNVANYKQKLQEKNKEGLNLNNNTRDFIELPSRDTVKFENLKF